MFKLFNNIFDISSTFFDTQTPLIPEVKASNFESLRQPSCIPLCYLSYISLVSNYLLWLLENSNKTCFR